MSKPMKLLFKNIDDPTLVTLQGYEQRGGYQAARKALRMSREEVLNELESSGRILDG